MRKFSLIMVAVTILLLAISFSCRYRIAPRIPNGKVGLHNVTGMKMSEIRAIFDGQPRVTNLSEKPLSSGSFHIMDMVRGSFSELQLKGTDDRIYRVKSPEHRIGRKRILTIFPDSKLPAFTIVNNIGAPIVWIGVDGKDFTTRGDTLRVNQTSKLYTIYDTQDDHTYVVSVTDNTGMRYSKAGVTIPDIETLTFTKDDKHPVITFVNNTGTGARGIHIKENGAREWIRIGGSNLNVAEGRSHEYQIQNPARRARYDVRVGSNTNITTSTSFSKYDQHITKDVTLTFTPEDSDPRVTIANRTSYPISTIQIRPAGTSDWGRNQISTRVGTGSNVQFTFNDPSITSYDIRVVGVYTVREQSWFSYYDREYSVNYEKRNVTIADRATITFTENDRR